MEGFEMDENKKTVNNDENIASDNMNYSFDFANQVDDTATNDLAQNTTVNSETPVNSEVNTVAPETPVVAETVETNNSGVNETANVVSGEAVSAVDNVATTVSDETVNSVDNVANAEGVAATPSTNDNVSVEGMPNVVPVTPITPENTATEGSTTEEDSIELIKDKKATKRFLFILFVILIIFIVALPFIFNIAG